MLRHWLYASSEPVIAAIDLMALLLIAGATVYTFAVAMWLVATGRKSPVTNGARYGWVMRAGWWPA